MIQAGILDTEWVRLVIFLTGTPGIEGGAGLFRGGECGIGNAERRPRVIQAGILDTEWVRLVIFLTGTPGIEGGAGLFRGSECGMRKRDRGLGQNRDRCPHGFQSHSRRAATGPRGVRRGAGGCEHSYLYNFARARRREVFSARRLQGVWKAGACPHCRSEACPTLRCAKMEQRA